jgi:hypothetical protein
MKNNKKEKMKENKTKQKGHTRKERENDYRIMLDIDSCSILVLHIENNSIIMYNIDSSSFLLLVFHMSSFLFFTFLLFL